MAQFGYPISDVTNAWTAGGWADLDDASPGSDADFAYTADNPGAETLECALTASLGDPASSPDHIMRWRHVLIDGGTVASSAGTGCDLTTQLVQTTTLIGGKSTVALDTVQAWAADTYTLSSGEADAITDYTDLRIRFVAQGGGGSPANRRGAGVSWFELEVPNEDTTRKAHVTAFELESADAPRKAHVTAFEMEAQFATRKAHVTAFELEAENAARDARVTAFELEVGIAPRQAIITAFEMQLPGASDSSSPARRWGLSITTMAIGV